LTGSSFIARFHLPSLPIALFVLSGVADCQSRANRVKLFNLHLCPGMPLPDTPASEQKLSSDWGSTLDCRKVQEAKEYKNICEEESSPESAPGLVSCHNIGHLFNKFTGAPAHMQ
jgi:hypothetical protein